jgi:AcrR family transcriptional regulator
MPAKQNTDAGTPAGKPPKGAKRLATQQRIMDAFEIVLLRDGVSSVTVTAVGAEAGVGKGLVYHYFEGLEGLAEAWMQRADLKPTPEDIAGEALDSFRKLPPLERLARIHSNYATMLKNKPAACQILVEDLQPGSSLPGILDQVRKHMGESHEALVTQDVDFNNPDAIAKSFVLQAAANYLALRAHSSPNYNGLQLDTDEGWSQMMAMLETVALSGD